MIIRVIDWFGKLRWFVTENSTVLYLLLITKRSLTNLKSKDSSLSCRNNNVDITEISGFWAPGNMHLWVLESDIN